MKKWFVRVACIVPLLTLCILSCLLFTSPSAHAAALTSSPAAKPLAVGCLIPNLVEIDNLSITFSDRLNSQKIFHLRVNLYGTYNNQGEYCGKMKAEAVIAEPAFVSSGTLTVRLQQGDEQDLDVNSTQTNGGGLDGQTTTVDTARVATQIGRINATYSNPDGTTGFIETNPFNGG